MNTITESSPVDRKRRKELVDDLWSACKEHHKRDFSDPDNGLGILTERHSDGVLYRVTTKLWKQQPFGVLYGHEIHKRKDEEGSVIIDSIYPRSATVASDVMPQEHMAVKFVPTEIWLAERGRSLAS